MLSEQEFAALREMLDFEALRQLNARFAHAVDRRDIAMLRSIYLADAVEDHGEIYRGPASGFIDRLCDPARPQSWHIVGNSIFHVDQCTAEGETYFVGCTIRADPHRMWLVGGRYLDVYQKNDLGWKIASRTVVRDWVQETPVTEGYTDFLSSLGAPAASGLSDPVYKTLKAFVAARQD